MFTVAMDVNWLAVVACVFVAQIVGILWYAPFAFGKKWIALTGQEDGAKISKGPAIVTTIAYNTLLMICFAVLSEWVGVTNRQEGAVLGLVVGVGIVLATKSVNAAFDTRSRELVGITSAQHTISLILAGIILAEWP